MKRDWFKRDGDPSLRSGTGGRPARSQLNAPFHRKASAFEFRQVKVARGGVVLDVDFALTVE